MNELGQDPGAVMLWIALVLLVLVGAAIAFFWYKGRPIPGEHVFRASRLSRGNLLFPTQVAVTPPASCISRRSFSARVSSRFTSPMSHRS